MSKELMEIGGFITSGAEIVNHDNSLSGNGTVESPLGVDSDYIVVTQETVGTYNVGGSDTAISGNFSKEGYKPIAWKVTFSFAGVINFNEETTTVSNNTLHLGGYAHTLTGNYSNISFKIFITWCRL
jgi:hypothetical protein